jgi:hypothetical protein
MLLWAFSWFFCAVTYAAVIDIPKCGSSTADSVNRALSAESG